VTRQGLVRPRETKQIPVTIFRPDGAGPFPLVINEPRPRDCRQARASKVVSASRRFSRYMVSKGFVVLLPDARRLCRYPMATST